MIHRLVFLFAAAGSFAWAVECKPPARLVQAAGENQTLMSWCEVDGVKNGPFEQFSMQHGLEVRAHYSDGKLNGSFQRFFANGKLASEGEFKDDRMTGRWTRFQENGERRDVTAWADDKLVAAPETPPKAEGRIRTSDPWRLRFGVAHTKSGDGSGDNGGPELGADFHLVDFGRWLRFELSLRVMPDYSVQYNNGSSEGKHGYTPVVSFAFEPFSGWLSPFALSIAPGVFVTKFKKPQFGGSIGFRYQWRESRPGFHVHGVYFQGGGHDNKSDDGNQCNNNCGGPGSYSGSNNSGSNFVETGILFTL